MAFDPQLFEQYLENRGTCAKNNFWDAAALEFIQKLQYLKHHYEDKVLNNPRLSQTELAMGQTNHKLTVSEVLDIYETFEPLIQLKPKFEKEVIPQAD